MELQKSIEISDAKIQFVSLVDQAANLRQFLVTKGRNGRAQFSSYGKILKVNADTHYITGIVYEPLVEDAHGNFMTEAEITKAAYWFMKNGDKVDLQHSFEGEDGLCIVENYVAPCDMEIGNTLVVKGSWLITVECSNDEVWACVQKGELTGFSMGGLGQYAEEETALEKTEKTAPTTPSTSALQKLDKKGLLKRLADALGLDPIEKGEVLDKFKESSRASQFWNALNALESVLYHYNWSGDRYVFANDPSAIREALEDFSTIITQVLVEEADAIAKSITLPLFKAGKKMSSGNKKKLDDICQALSDFKTGFDEEEEEKEDEEGDGKGAKKQGDSKKKPHAKKQEESDMNETVRKCLEEAGILQKAAASPENIAGGMDLEDAVEKAVRTCLEGCGLLASDATSDKPVTKADIEGVVAETVSRAIEPLLKARGLSSNLNGERPVEKGGEHFLHGIL